MRLKFTYFLLLGILIMALLQSNSSGNTSTSCASASCHNTGTGITTIDSIYLVDKATSLPVQEYTPGATYLISVIGNHAGTTLPNFGFQVGSNSVGTFSGFRATAHLLGGFWTHSAASTSIVPIPNIYVDTCTWTAPAAGTGAVTFSGLLNAVNNDGGTGGDMPTMTTYTRVFQEKILTASVAISQTKGTVSICFGDTVTFVATPTNGGTAPSYQWKVNGTNVGTNSSTFTSFGLSIGTNQVTCVMTSNLAGVSGSPATSNIIPVFVAAKIVNTTSISANMTTACAGDTIIFAATKPTGSTSTRYHWYQNNILVQSGFSQNYIKSGMANNDSIYCKVTMSNTCKTVDTAKSNAITMTINTSPTASGFADQNKCNGDSTDATAWTSTIGGTTYTWTNSNTNIGLAASGSGQIPKFKATNTTNNVLTATITVVPFASGCKGASFTYKYIISPTPSTNPPSSRTFCTNSNGNIFISATFGSTVNWSVNNTNIGLAATGTGSTINFTPINNTADTIMAILTTSATLNGCTGSSSNMTLIINPIVHANKPPNLEVCDGQIVNQIPLTSSNATATLRWNNPDPSIGLGSFGNGNIPSFTAVNTGTTPKVIDIKVNARYGNCNGPDSVFQITINPKTPSEVTIFTKDTIVCPGSSSFVRSTSANEGDMPTYQWYKNNSPIVGGTKDTITILNIMDSDNIYCVMTSNSTCASNLIDTSNVIKFKTINNISPSVTISAVKDSICVGQTLTINTTTMGGGATPTYQWYLNNQAISGATSDFFVSSNWKNGDKIVCDMTSSISCASITTVSSNSKTIRVFPEIATSLTMTKSKNKICSDDIVVFTPTYTGQGLHPVYEWTLNGQPMGSNPISLTIPIANQFDIVKFKMISGNYCGKPRDTSVSLSIDTVIQGPIVGISPNNYKAFCDGDSVKVSTNGGQPTYSYLWSNGATTDSFFSKSSTSYYVTVTDPALVCPRKYGPITTYKNPLPEIPVASKEDSFVVSSIAINYQWQLNQLDLVGAIDKTYLYNQTGLYRVKVVNDAGCIAYSNEIDPYAIITTGISSLSQSDIVIYPNPASNKIYITATSYKNLSIALYDIKGKKLAEKSILKSDNSLDITPYAAGSYLLKINSSSGIRLEKLEIK